MQAIELYEALRKVCHAAETGHRIRWVLDPTTNYPLRMECQCGLVHHMTPEFLERALEHAEKDGGKVLLQAIRQIAASLHEKT